LYAPSQEASRQPTAENCVDRGTETWPPNPDTSVLNKQVMKEIENSVSGDGCRHDEYRWIEGSLAVQPNYGGEAGQMPKPELRRLGTPFMVSFLLGFEDPTRFY